MDQQVARDTAWNVAGALLPIAAGLWAFPKLLNAVEPEAFGWLSIAWIVLGAGGLFDLGLGRALTREVSTQGSRLDARVRAGLQLSLVSGIVFALAGAVLAPGLAAWVGVGALEPGEVTQSLRILSVALLAIVLSSAFRGILEGDRFFMLANAVRGPSIAASFLLPLVVEPELPNLVAAAVAGRWLGTVAYAWIIRRWWKTRSAAWRLESRTGVLCQGGGPSTEFWGPMIRFGGAVTLTSAFAFVLSQADRVLVARVLGTAVLGTWSPVFEVISRVMIFPVAFASALFPRMVRWSDRPGAGGTALGRAGLSVAFALLLPCLGMFVIVPTALDLWLGVEVPLGVTQGARWLVVGVYFNAVAQVPFAFLQASGRPGIPAMLNGLELPVYLLLLTAFLEMFGIAGAGMAWAIRASADAVFMYVAAVALARSRRVG